MGAAVACGVRHCKPSIPEDPCAAQTKWEAPRPVGALSDFVLLLSPYAPHVAEELWSRLSHSDTLTYEPWPTAEESLLVQNSVKLPVQVSSLCFNVDLKSL